MNDQRNDASIHWPFTPAMWFALLWTGLSNPPVHANEQRGHPAQSSRRSESRQDFCEPGGKSNLFASFATDTEQEASTRQSLRRNIIVILADDLGYGDTSVYDDWVKTPALQRMAAEGLTFTDFHSNSSVCSPTRAGFLTGRYQQRVGVVDVVARHLDTPGLDPSELTLPRLFKTAGYRTALFGKWHLGSQPANNPIHHGFDEFRGYLGGYVDYHDHRSSWFHGLLKEDQVGIHRRSGAAQA